MSWPRTTPVCRSSADARSRARHRRLEEGTHDVEHQVGAGEPVEVRGTREDRQLGRRHADEVAVDVAARERQLGVDHARLRRRGEAADGDVGVGDDVDGAAEAGSAAERRELERKLAEMARQEALLYSKIDSMQSDKDYSNEARAAVARTSLPLS